ncbi:MAG: hypothetical protein ABSC03_08610 [Verrucomicrobiota bacterium]|jgi:hypothetical protein
MPGNRAMPDEAFIEQLNRGYVCPPDAGPAWRAAAVAGIDLSLIELSLAKTPWERWVEHDDALSFSLQLRDSVSKHYGEA